METFSPRSKETFLRLKRPMPIIGLSGLLLVSCGENTDNETPNPTIEAVPVAPTEVTPCPIIGKEDLEEGKSDPECHETLPSPSPSPDSLIICPIGDPDPNCG